MKVLVEDGTCGSTTRERWLISRSLPYKTSSGAALDLVGTIRARHTSWKIVVSGFSGSAAGAKYRLMLEREPTTIREPHHVLIHTIAHIAATTGPLNHLSLEPWNSMKHKYSNL